MSWLEGLEHMSRLEFAATLGGLSAFFAAVVLYRVLGHVAEIRFFLELQHRERHPLSSDVDSRLPVPRTTEDPKVLVEEWEKKPKG
jgi:hypothetical protein